MVMISVIMSSQVSCIEMVLFGGWVGVRNLFGVRERCLIVVAVQYFINAVLIVLELCGHVMKSS